MKKPDRFLNYFLYVALLSIGILVGVAIRHYYNLPISETFNIIDLCTLVTTVFLAIYIPEVLDRKLRVKRDKKDLIEKRIEELQMLYRRINQIVQDEEPLRSKDILILKNTLDIAKHRQELIISLLKYSHMSISFEKDIRKIRSLTKEHRELLLANDMNVESFTYNDDIQQKEELLYNQIDEVTSLLVFKLSEA